MQVQWTPTFIMTLVWLVVVLSCVSSVFYLVPPTTAIQAWLAFDESLDGFGVAGFCLAVTAVYLVVKKPNLLRKLAKPVLEH